MKLGEMMEITGSFAFAIIDEQIDFDEISENILLTPTKVIKKGQLIALNKTAPFDIWSYEIKIVSLEIAEELESLITQLLPYSDFIKSFGNKYRQVVINCYLRSELGQIGIDIPSGIVDKLAQLGIGFSFHILSFGGVEE